MVTDTIRALWSEPRVADPPPRTWRDWAIVVVLIPAVILEAVLRDELVWPVTSLVVGLALAPLLLWRRSQPVLVTVAAFGLVGAVDIVALVQDVSWQGLNSMIALLLLPYSLFRWGSGRGAAAGLGVMLLVALSSGFDASNSTGDVAGGVLILCLTGAVGTAVRYQDTVRIRELDQIKLRERGELARELHDSVAHHVSAIAIQAQAGRTLAATRPNAAVDALEVIEEEASRTLAEMRAMVGALRQGEEPELTPQQGVADIARLAAYGNGDGPRIDVEYFGDLDDLRPAVDATLYRLAQESITNAVRHARKASSINVRVAGDVDCIRLTVSDDGLVDSPGTTGYGLVGMAERAKLLGGTLDAGPSGTRGWTVAAVVPRNGAPS